ncbi:DDB1- and CUL4-associated factor 6-like isoform X1 [Panulirus ornatus]|uniref:DDB1- and CUL4-associated factor 6-like isoform X1 n=2 Tax=Panulirus ornatus TaxID=150431 RepID=UPI003A8B21AC
MLRHILKRQYDPVNNSFFYPFAKGNESLLQRMSLLQAMEVHRGCVNTVVWDAPGNLLLSGSDDQHLVLCDPWERMTKTRIHTAHRANIFSAKFLPQTTNRKIISCSGDGILIYTDIERQEETHDCKFTCHGSTCYDVITLPDDPHTFLSCGEDGTVRWFDLRAKEQCSTRNCQEDILLNMGRAVTAVAVNPITPYHLAVATQDSTIRIYDRRMLGTRATDSYLEQADRALLMRLKPDNMEGKNHRVTALRYSQDGQEILASYSSDYLYLFDTQSYKEVSLGATVDNDAETNSGPTLKRLRLRGDWSDTGPQALPESEMRNQAGDVGQARPTLHATLMQRMTDVLSRMLNDPGTRASVQRTASESESSQNRSNSLSETSGDVEVGTESGQSPTSNSDVQPSTSAPSAEALHTSSATESSVEGAAQCPSALEDPLSGSHVNSSDETKTSKTDSQNVKPVQLRGFLLPFSSTQQGSQPSQPEASEAIPEEMEVESSRCVSSDHKDEKSLNDAQKTTDPERVFDSSLEGLQDQISSLRRGFVQKHQVEPSVNLSYSGQGVGSGMISLGVGDEVSRDTGSHHEVEEPSSSQAALLSSSPQPQSSSISQSHQSTESNVCDQPSCSSSSSSLSSSSPSRQPPVTKAHSITTSSSSPAICDMEVEPSSSSQAGRGGPGSEAVAQGSCNHGTRASELNLGPALDFGDDDSDDEPFSARAASARMASAIERAVQRARGNRAAGVGGDMEMTVPQAAVKQCYKGHRNARTMIKEACFWGDTHVMSGSDCGRVFVWERKTGRLVMLWEADRHVVNCLQPHPTLPVLATSGIDYDLKLWAPLCEDSRFDEAKAKEITQRNEALLDETRDTITVPATFMIRMLASLNQIRRGTTFAERWRNRRQARRQSEEEDQGGSSD